VPEYLKDFDSYMQDILGAWKAPGIGVGIVESDSLVFAKGYGYRDYEKGLPFTASTLFPIGSNTKLFTSIVAGLLVADGLLSFDMPIRDFIPSLRFYSDQLNQAVTLRDMLAHRTGITRHDHIWYRSDFTRKELFDRIRYLEPVEPLRQKFIYNNLMYAAVGYAMELRTGKAWEQLVRERILEPLAMQDSCFSIEEMLTRPDFVVPFTLKRDSDDIIKIPHYEEMTGIGPAGAINSNIEDLSRWLIALMNDGAATGRSVIPASVLKETLAPAIPIPNVLGETWGFWEQIGDAYGLGRQTASYRGHLLTFHGGGIDGFVSQVSYMPLHRIGVIVLAIGNHCAFLPNTISYSIYERFLGLDQTPWSERWLDVERRDRQVEMDAREKSEPFRARGTAPSHPLADYAGDYEHPAYGMLGIALVEDELLLDFHKASLPLTHYHYDRFDTSDDERRGKFSVNFGIGSQGDIDRAMMSIDGSDVTFTRRYARLDHQRLRELVGTYESPAGWKCEVTLKDGEQLSIAVPWYPEQDLTFYKDLVFRVAGFSDQAFEFMESTDGIAALKQIIPAGEWTFVRKHVNDIAS